MTEILIAGFAIKTLLGELDLITLTAECEIKNIRCKG